MADLKHKTTMISLRLSEAELDFLRSRYQSYGARNVSDLARLALQRLMLNWNIPDQQLVLLAGRVSVLEARLALLSERAEDRAIRPGPLRADDTEE
jgi:hypothetical protein